MLMHNSLEGLPTRVLIDTNVLLDAAFVTNGAARRSLTLLSQLGYSPVIDEMIELEAIRILEKYRKFFYPAFDLAKVLSDCISVAGILRLPPAKHISNTSVKPHDIHVVSAAAQYGAWVLTGDLALNVQLRADGIQARLPFDVIMEAATADGADPGLDDIVRIVAPTRQSGMLFGSVIAGNWAGMSSVGSFTVCDMENVGRIFYDTQTQEWAFEMPIGVSVRVECPLQKGEQWAVCGSYKLPGAGKRGRLLIRAGQYPSTIFSESISTQKNIASSSPGVTNIGSSVSNQDYWNGHLRSVVIGPQGMSTDTWKKIIAIPEGAPNPYDSDALSRVLERAGSLNSQPGLLQLPTEQDLRNLNL